MAEKKAAKKPRRLPRRRHEGRGIHGRRTSRDEGSRPRAEGEARASKNRADGERDLLAAIAAMREPDRAMAKRLHAIITEAAPDLWPKTWYGMPAYAKDGKVVCFFKAADKFDSRYATFGFEDAANIDSRRHVADLLRADGADRRRREEDRRAREEGGAMRPDGNVTSPRCRLPTATT